ncbi:hypothetical protein [Novibacillus thermophilus]|uniref:hypothetical protein n=1 Tax=Novibacillus thermophilus TaxID=1471761 RepID=UPI001474C976|nr:hypothetical protein [Novibacillus thermophilus]
MGVSLLLVGLSTIAAVVLTAMYQKHFRSWDEVVKTEGYVVETDRKWVSTTCCTNLS